MSEVRQPQRRTVLQRIALLLLGLALLASAGAQRTLTIAQTVDIPGFDPHNHGLTAVEAVITNVFDYLLFRDANGDIQSALATGYEQVDDLTWRFTLRDDVVWHDGQPFTAADVKFSLERVARDESLFEHDSFQQIAEVEIVNDHEVLIHTSRSEEHTSELQSRPHLVCRLLLEKKKYRRLGSTGCAVRKLCGSGSRKS